ncbi:MAG: CheR family methyltransferase [Nannocystaceae bacterium]
MDRRRSSASTSAVGPLGRAAQGLRRLELPPRPPPSCARYFVPVGEGERASAGSPTRSRRCATRRLNLVDAPAIAGLGGVDLVFCRNVLIYMGAAARRQIVDAFFTALVPGGYLLLGHSESLLNHATPYEVVRLDRDVVYRRPPGPAAP